MTRSLSAAALAGLLVVPAAAGDDAKAYTIVLRKEAVGDAVKVALAQTDVETGTFRADLPGQSAAKRDRTVTRRVYVEDVLAVAPGGGPTKLTRRYDVAESVTNGQPVPQGYAGKRVLIEKTGDRYAYSIDGTPLLGKDAAEWEGEFGKTGSVRHAAGNQMTDKPVRVGDTWVVDASKTAASIIGGGPITFDAEKAKITGKLLKAYVKAGAQFGVVETTMKLPAVSLKNAGEDVPLRPGSTVTVATVYDLCIDGSSRTSAEKMTVSYNLTGAALTGRVTVTGSVKRERTVTDLRTK